MRISIVFLFMVFFVSANSFAANTWIFPLDNTRIVERFTTGIKTTPEFYKSTVDGYERMCGDHYNNFQSTGKSVKMAYRLSVPEPIEMDGNLITSARCELLLTRL